MLIDSMDDDKKKKDTKGKILTKISNQKKKEVKKS